MKIYTTLIATLLVIGLMAPTVSTQTDRKIDYPQMVEDIEIMCRIIDQNMKELFPKEYHLTAARQGWVAGKHGVLGIPGRRGCQGFYLKNYGVIFTLEVQFPVTQKEIPVAPKKKPKADLWEQLEREVRHQPYQVDTLPVRQRGKKYDSEKVDKLKELLGYIVGKYSQRIDQLDSDEKISIVINSRSEHLSDLGSNRTVTLRLQTEPLETVIQTNKEVIEALEEELTKELVDADKKLNTLRKEYDKLRSFPSTTMILTFNETDLRDATDSDWEQILASADIVQY